MPIRKDFIAFTSQFSKFLPLGALQALSGKRFIIPFYHIVSNDPCPHVKHLYQFKSVKQFEKDIDYLARAYKPIGAAELSEVPDGKYDGQNIMLLTFDDGLRQMYDEVAPMLQRKGIPAVFFLNTDFLDNRDLMFRYKVSLAIEKNGRNRDAFIHAESASEFEKITGGELAGYYKDFLTTYKPYLSTGQVHWLLNKGFAIGAHSCSHPYYRTLALEQQLDETLRCIDILQQQFRINQKLFAFPFTDHGVSRSFFEQVFAGGKVDFTFGGAGIKDDIDWRQLQRIPMEGPHAGAEQILKSEYLYYLLRAALFKNTIVRN